MNASSFKWLLACWGTACLLVLSPLMDDARHPNSHFLLPNTFNDALLYRAIIQKAAPGDPGDPFLWEHRHSPQSLLNLVRLWPIVYGQVIRHGGDGALLALSTALSGLWFFALFRFAKRLGLPPPAAFFAAGVQCFFIVNLAYQIIGFKTNFGAYSFWITEHMRLYPSVTAMAWYSVAAVAVAWALETGQWQRLLAAGATVALTAYGRPFDWMVLMGALTVLLSASVIWKRDTERNRTAAILAVALAFSAGFILGFSSFMKAFRPAYEDQIARGNLQVKQLSHYVKYSLLAIPLVLGVVGSLWRLKVREGLERNPRPNQALLWLASLAISSLLVHYKSLAEGGITLVGFAYPVIFSVFPWFFLLTATLLCRRWAPRHPSWFQHRGWIALLVGLLLIQQIGILTQLRRQRSSVVVPRERLTVYRQIRDEGGADAVVLTLGRGLEVSAFAGGRLFFPNPVVAAYVCAAPTSELLERFCAAKLLLTGTLEDLRPLFAHEGLAHFNAWVAAQPPATRFWVGLLEETVGHNAFVFHPSRNRGELSHRGIQLPEPLRHEEDFVVFFPPEWRDIFECCARLQPLSAESDLQWILQRYRLNDIYIPQSALQEVDLKRLEHVSRLRERSLSESAGGRLWEVLP